MAEINVPREPKGCHIDHLIDTGGNEGSYLSSYPGYFQEPHWISMGLLEISRVTLRGMKAVRATTFEHSLIVIIFATQ